MGPNHENGWNGMFVFSLDFQISTCELFCFHTKTIQMNKMLFVVLTFLKRFNYKIH